MSFHPQNVLVVAEKNSVAADFLAGMRRTAPWPGVRVHLMVTHVLGPFRFRYPDIGSSDLPYVGNPMLRMSVVGLPSVYVGNCPTSPEAEACSEDGMLAMSGFSKREDSDTAEQIGAFFKAADLIVNCACDHRSVLTFRDLLSCADGPVPAQTESRIYEVRMESHSPREVDGLVSRLVPDSFGGGFSDFGGYAFIRTKNDPLLRWGEAEEFIDWNWRVNADALLGKPLRESGGHSRLGEPERPIAGAALLGKFSILLLLAMRRGAPEVGLTAGHESTDVKIISAMTKWVGTGKYAVVEPSGFGDLATRAGIVERLLETGLLERTGHVTWTKTWRMNNSPWNFEWTTATRRVVEALITGPEGLREPMTVESMLRETAETLADHKRPSVFIAQMKEAAKQLGILSERPTREIMRDLGLMQRFQSGLKVSKAGERFADRLGKDAYDPDLPFRLHAWYADWPNSRSAMESYLRRYFGHMKRALGMHDLAFGEGKDVASEVAPDEELAKRAQIASSLQADKKLTPGQRRALALAVRRDGPKL